MVILKNWYESRTVWFNLLGLLVVVLEYLGQINLIDPELLGGLLGLGNVLLRFRTNEGVKI